MAATGGGGGPLAAVVSSVRTVTTWLSEGRGTGDPASMCRPVMSRCEQRGRGIGRIGWAGLLVTDLDVADESPCSDLELGTLARFHADALIAKECAAARDHPCPG